MGLVSKTLKHSLQWRLLLTLTAVCLLFSGLVATVSFYQSYRQAQLLQDAKLESLVSLAKSHDLSIENDQIDIDLKRTNKANQSTFQTPIDALEEDIATNQTLIFWLDDSRLQGYFSQDTIYHLAKKPDGLYEIQGRNGLWRLYIYTQMNTQAHADAKERHLVIGELLDIRNQLAWQSAKKILFPLLLLIPVLLLVIIATIHRVFKPLVRVTDVLNQRFDTNIDASPYLKNSALKNELINPLNEAKLPSEILPFIQVIRQQMQHLLDSLALNERFVRNASHQLRTPMTAILLQAEQIKLNDTATPEQIHEQSHAIDHLLESIKRNNHLINQLLTLSKSEQKSPTLPSITFSASQVVTDVLLDCYPIASQKNINLGVTELQDITINMAELAFKIIVQNLIDNALKYTPNGGRVDISLFAENGYSYLVVQDSGIGIAEAELNTILEPFYRATAVTHAPKKNQLIAEGFGLGLAIVNNLVIASQAELTLINHHNLQKNSPNFRSDIAERIQTYHSPLIESTASPLLPTETVNEFTTGLYVQIRWQNPN